MKRQNARKNRKRPSSNKKFFTIACLIAIVSFIAGVFFSRIPAPKAPPVVKPPAPPSKTVSAKPVAGTIALILDDWGNSETVLPFIDAVNVPIAIAVLPKLPLSKKTAEHAYARGKEVMIHLPMEPHYTAEKYPNDYLIKSSMSSAEVKKLIDESLRTIPFAQGMNNHMGSKATEDRTLVKIIYSYLKQKDFFFVDSATSEQSVCEDVAKDLKVPFTKRDIFIDNKADRVYIEERVAELARLAQKHKLIVGIGHARPLTLEILQAQIPILQKKGFKFITVKQMIVEQEKRDATE